MRGGKYNSGVTRVIAGLTSTLLLIGFQACSPRSAISTQGLIGTAVGAGTGILVGSALGDKVSLSSSAKVAGGVAGAGLGLLAGGLIYDGLQTKAPEPVVRKAAYDLESISRQDEIDELRQKLDESISWGRSEVKPWNDRYLGENPDVPYQSRGNPLSNEF